MIKCAATDRRVFADDREYDLPDVEALDLVNAGHAVPAPEKTSSAVTPAEVNKQTSGKAARKA
jgi:hypothetical protein